MPSRRFAGSMFAALIAVWTLHGPARAQDPAPVDLALAAPVVVLELFTSQGCSSCPDADALLGELSDDDDVVALAFHVDYWDYLGWLDEFADPAHDLRQRAYAMTLGARSIYTPQMVVHGGHGLVGHNRMAIEAAIALHAEADAVAEIWVDASGDPAVIEVRAIATDAVGPAEVVIVGYDHPQEVSIGGGENGGRTLTYHNVVRDFRALGVWDGGDPLRLEASLDPELAGYAILVQRADAGPILAAVAIRD